MAPEKTYGQSAVGLSFNPSGREDVQHIKELYAQIIDLLHDHAHNPLDAEIEPNVESLCGEAITQAMTAQMWAVKAVTWETK